MWGAPACFGVAAPLAALGCPHCGGSTPVSPHWSDLLEQMLPLDCRCTVPITTWKISGCTPTRTPGSRPSSCWSVHAAERDPEPVLVYLDPLRTTSAWFPPFSPNCLFTLADLGILDVGPESRIISPYTTLGSYTPPRHNGITPQQPLTSGPAGHRRPGSSRARYRVPPCPSLPRPLL